MEKAASKRFRKRPEPCHAFGKGLHHKKPLEKGTKATKAKQEPLEKGCTAKQEPLEKGPKPLRKGSKLLGKSFNPVSPAEPLEKGSKLLEKSLNSVSPAKCTETSRPTSGQLEKNNQLMKNSENEI